MTTNQTGTAQDAIERSSPYRALIRYTTLTEFAMHAMRLNELEATLAQALADPKGLEGILSGLHDSIKHAWQRRRQDIAAMREMDPPVSYPEIGRITGLSATRAREIGRKVEGDAPAPERKVPPGAVH